MKKYARKLLLPILFGRAAAQFSKGNYHRASKLFEKTLGLDPDDDRIEYTLACIGRCHAKLKAYDMAFVYLDKAFEIYQKKGIHFSNIDEQNEYRAFLRAYKETLQNLDKPERSSMPEA